MNDISYWGTLVIILLLAIGWLISISRPAKPSKPPETDPENPGYVKFQHNKTVRDEFGETHISSAWYKESSNRQKSYQKDMQNYQRFSIGWTLMIIAIVGVIVLSLYAAVTP